MQDSLVLDPARNTHHEFVVVDSVKKFGQVKIHDPVVSRFDVLSREFDRVVRASPGSKPKAELAKRWVENRREYLKQRLLDQAIGDAWNPK